MREVFVLGLIALAVSSVGIVVATNYDEWFVHPEMIKNKRGHAVQNLRDPASAQFRNEQLTRNGWLCGELNSKNAYGAYTGFKRFISRDYGDAWIEGLGYAGKSGALSTVHMIEDLDVQNKLLGNLLEVAKADPSLPTPTREEIVGLEERAIFERR